MIAHNIIYAGLLSLLRFSRRIYKKPAKLKHPFKIEFYLISENTILCLGNKQCFYRVPLSRFIYV